MIFLLLAIGFFLLLSFVYIMLYGICFSIVFFRNQKILYIVFEKQNRNLWYSSYKHKYPNYQEGIKILFDWCKTINNDDTKQMAKDKKAMMSLLKLNKFTMIVFLVDFFIFLLFFILITIINGRS